MRSDASANDHPGRRPVPVPGETRRRWHRLEAIHAVTYFAVESRAAADDVGCEGFWMGYFGFRAAPMGPVSAATVEATFANFAPRLVRRAVPDVWDRARPRDLLYARATSAATVLRRVHPGVDAVFEPVIDDLAQLAAVSDGTGRPLGAANQAVQPTRDVVAAAWQHCTTLRELRGDGHVASLVAEGLSGLDAHLLAVAAGAVPGERLREARGWTPEEWEDAARDLVDRGLLHEDGSFTEAGAATKARVEETTDRLAAPAWWELPPDRVDAVEGALATVAISIAGSDALVFPNPIGLDESAYDAD